jgi:replicative DNA helicase
MDRGEHAKNLELHSREAEQCLVAALFGDQGSDIFNQLALTGLTPDDFFVPALRLAYAAAIELAGRGTYPDRSMLAAYIKSSPSFTDVIRAEVTQAIAAPYAAANVANYADVVIEKSRARKIAAGLEQLMARTGQVGGDIRSDDLVREIDAVSLGLGERNVTNELLYEPEHHLGAVVRKLDAKQNGEADGVQLGIRDLDEKLGGLQGGELIVVAGRPSMGKSTLGFGILSHHGLKAVPGIGLPGPLPDPADVPLVAGFSLEMPIEQLAQRILSDIANVPFPHLRKATLADDEWVRLTEAFQKYGRTDIRIDSDSYLTPATLRAKVRVLERRTGKKVRLIVIDYLQLMSGDERHQNRASEISEITRKLKLLAKELDVPIVLLSQLNRDLEKRTDKRPMMSDLRESGAIEQDADIIIFIYRDEYYNPDSPARGMAEIILGKGRNAGTGTVLAQFSGVYQRFFDCPADYGYESTYGSGS